MNNSALVSSAATMTSTWKSYIAPRKNQSGENRSHGNRKQIHRTVRVLTPVEMPRLGLVLPSLSSLAVHTCMQFVLVPRIISSALYIQRLDT